MLFLPFRQSSECFLLILPLAHLDERVLLGAHSSLGRLDARRLTLLLAVVRRPRRIPLPFLLLPCGQLQQTCKRSGTLVDAGMTVADLCETLWHRTEREVLRLRGVDLIPAEGRRDARIRH